MFECLSIVGSCTYLYLLEHLNTQASEIMVVG